MEQVADLRAGEVTVFGRLLHAAQFRNLGAKLLQTSYRAVRSASCKIKVFIIKKFFGLQVQRNNLPPPQTQFCGRTKKEAGGRMPASSCQLSGCISSRLAIIERLATSHAPVNSRQKRSIFSQLSDRPSTRRRREATISRESV